MDKYVCDICGSKETYVKDYKHEYTVKNKKITITSKNRFCSKCNNLVYDAYLDNITLKEIFREYNKSIGITKEDIINLRHRYNLTQEQFSKIIGCAKKTLISYEKGTSIPNDIYLVTIKTLLDNPEVLEYMIESNKDRYAEKEYEIINQRISESYKNNNSLFSEEKENEPTEYNGFTELSYDKIKNMILILSKNGLLKTKLLKEMFYIDFISYKERGCSITGLEYAKCPYGPVPDEFDKIINTFVKEKSIKYEVEYSELGYEYHNINSLEKNNNKVFDEKELEIINRVKEFFKNFNTKKIVEFSHEEKAFKETEMFKLIDYSYAFDIDRI